jgi:hypothetical protein
MTPPDHQTVLLGLFAVLAVYLIWKRKEGMVDMSQVWTFHDDYMGMQGGPTPYPGQYPGNNAVVFSEQSFTGKGARVEQAATPVAIDFPVASLIVPEGWTLSLATTASEQATFKGPVQLDTTGMASRPGIKTMATLIKS